MAIKFKAKSETDLFELAKNKTVVLSMCFSHDGEQMVMFCKDRKIRFFHVGTGKLLKVYNESLASLVAQQDQAKKDDLVQLDKIDFERRLAVEKELDKHWDATPWESSPCPLPSIGLDESDQFLYLGSHVGIKVINVASNALIRVLGKVENTERFLQIALF